MEPASSVSTAAPCSVVHNPKCPLSGHRPQRRGALPRVCGQIAGRSGVAPMLKIVEIHAASGVQGEYIVLQNMGLVTVSLRGWALCSDAFLEGEPAKLAEEMYIFREDVAIKPYTNVVLFTGEGEDGWVPTIDGKQAYCAYWGRPERLWTHR